MTNTRTSMEILIFFTPRLASYCSFDQLYYVKSLRSAFS